MLFHFSLISISFQFAVPSSSRQRRRNRLFYEFFIPVLPEHERTHVVEFRVLNSDATSTTSPLSGDIPLATSNRRDRRSWAVVVKKNGIRIYKGTRRYRPIKDGMYDVFDVTESVASYLNENRGNLIIVIKERSRDENDDDDDDDSKEGHDSSDKVNCASPGNGLLVLYSRNSHFFHDIYQRFTTGSSPAIAEHRQRRHSQMNGAQRRRQRSRQREKSRKNKKTTEKDSKQIKRNKTKLDEIPCGRYDYTIDFDVIGWGKWIVAPKKFNAYLCSGSCAFDIDVQHNSSNHAMLQSLMRLKQPDITPLPCCVPTKLRPISMMYFEMGEIVVRKHQDVIAEECGCR